MLFCHHEKTYAESNKDLSFFTISNDRAARGIRKAYFFAFEKEIISLIMITKQKNNHWSVVPPDEREDNDDGKHSYRWQIGR